MTVVVGVIADKLGAASQWVTVPANNPGRNFNVERRFMTSPSTEYRSIQASVIPVDVDHERPIGQVRYLELGRNGYLTAVSEIDGSALGEGPWFYSPEIVHRAGTDIELTGLAVTRKPASVALPPLEPFVGTLDEAARGVVYKDGWAGSVVQRAAEYDRARRRGEPLVVCDRNPPAPAPELPSAQPLGRIEYRSAQALDVSPRDRTIEVLAVPYGTAATVHHEGRWITETISNTAFADVDRQENRSRIKATREHKPELLFGRVTTLDPFRPEGLRAEIKVARTALGDETLGLAADELLDASIAFRIPDRDGERWEGRSRRRVLKAWLHEISLVSDPAYKGAKVLGIRSSTPRIDEVRQWQLVDLAVTR